MNRQNQNNSAVNSQKLVRQAASKTSKKNNRRRPVNAENYRELHNPIYAPNTVQERINRMDPHMSPAEATLASWSMNLIHGDNINKATPLPMGLSSSAYLIKDTTTFTVQVPPEFIPDWEEGAYYIEITSVVVVSTSNFTCPVVVVFYGTIFIGSATPGLWDPSEYIRAYGMPMKWATANRGTGDDCSAYKQAKVFGRNITARGMRLDNILPALYAGGSVASINLPNCDDISGQEKYSTILPTWPQNCITVQRVPGTINEVAGFPGYFQTQLQEGSYMVNKSSMDPNYRRFYWDKTHPWYDTNQAIMTGTTANQMTITLTINGQVKTAVVYRCTSSQFEPTLDPAAVPMTVDPGMSGMSTTVAVFSGFQKQYGLSLAGISKSVIECDLHTDSPFRGDQRPRPFISQEFIWALKLFSSHMIGVYPAGANKGNWIFDKFRSFWEMIKPIAPNIFGKIPIVGPIFGDIIPNIIDRLVGPGGEHQ